MGHANQSVDSNYVTVSSQAVKNINESLGNLKYIDFRPFEELVNKFL